MSAFEGVSSCLHRLHPTKEWHYSFVHPFILVVDVGQTVTEKERDRERESTTNYCWNAFHIFDI